MLINFLFFLDNDEYKLFMNGIIIFPGIANFLSVVIYSFLDVTRKPSFIRKYKVNPHTNEPPNYKIVIKVCNNEYKFLL